MREDELLFPVLWDGCVRRIDLVEDDDGDGVGGMFGGNACFAGRRGRLIDRRSAAAAERGKAQQAGCSEHPYNAHVEMDSVAQIRGFPGGIMYGATGGGPPLFETLASPAPAW